MEKEEVVLPTVEDMNVMPEALAGCNVVVTGFVPDEKKKLEDMLTDFNGTVSETVTQTTSFVLTGPEPSRTKIAAAKTSNILLVSLPTVIKVLTDEIKLDEMKHQLPPNIIRYGLSKSHFRKPSTNESSDEEKENATPNQVDRQSNLVTDAKSVVGHLAQRMVSQIWIKTKTRAVIHVTGKGNWVYLISRRHHLMNNLVHPLYTSNKFCSLPLCNSNLSRLPLNLSCQLHPYQSLFSSWLHFLSSKGSLNQTSLNQMSLNQTSLLNSPSSRNPSCKSKSHLYQMSLYHPLFSLNHPLHKCLNQL